MMNELFITKMRLAVLEPAVDGMMSVLHRPPGRQPSSALVELSRWFNQLESESQAQVRAVVHLTARNTVFGMLCALDAVTAMMHPEEEGVLELRLVKEGESILLNDPEGEFLHDLFNGQVPPP